jgi:dihydroflavonol-4-reductase
MKIAVTGASGHIGNNLCRMLTDLGHQVKALIHRESGSLAGLPLQLIKGDVTCNTDLEVLCDGCEVVFHLAAAISIRKTDPVCERVNVDSCRNLVRAARSTGIKKIIHFSSIHAFQEEPLNEELNETRELALGSLISYDQSKALGQKIMQESSSGKLETVILNPTAIIGPGDFKPSLLGNALIRFYKGQNPVLVPGGYNWVDVRDVCSAAVNAIEHGEPGACYLLAGSWQSLRTLAREIHKLDGEKAPMLEIPVWMAQAGAPLINLHAGITGKPPLYTAVSLHTLSHSHRNISSARAASALGFMPRPFIETLAAAIKWFRDNKYL